MFVGKLFSDERMCSLNLFLTINLEQQQILNYRIILNASKFEVGIKFCKVFPIFAVWKFFSQLGN